MQQLSNHLCTVEIDLDPTYTVDSADNRPYDRVLNPQGYHHSDATHTFSIRIEWPERTLMLALIGHYSSYPYDCALLEEDQLLVLQSRTLTRLRIWDGEILEHHAIPCTDVMNSLYPLPDGYLLVGTLEVFRMDRQMKEVWRYGTDFTVQWRMEQDHLRLWEETGYDRHWVHSRLGFDGKLLSEDHPAVRLDQLGGKVKGIRKQTRS